MMGYCVFECKKNPPPTKGGCSGNFKGSKNQKSGKCHELSRNIYIFFDPPHPFQKSGKFHELPRKSINIFLPPPPGGNFRGSKKQKSGKCRERPRKVIKSIFILLPPVHVTGNQLVINIFNKGQKS